MENQTTTTRLKHRRSITRVNQRLVIYDALQTLPRPGLGTPAENAAIHALQAAYDLLYEERPIHERAHAIQTHADAINEYVNEVA